jgi:hypothetical protein
MSGTVDRGKSVDRNADIRLSGNQVVDIRLSGYQGEITPLGVERRIS